MPSPEPILRSFSSLPSLSLGTTAAGTAKIPYRGMAGGVLFTNAVTGATTITWHVAYDEASTPVPLIDASGNSVTTSIVQGRGYEFPAAAYGAVVVCPVINTGSATVAATLKS